MRIIAGQWRARPIIAPSGIATRPTSDRVREALFSMLTSRLGEFAGLAVADLFAGSGALGLEALSRGAGHATFVERERAALAALKANVAKLGASAQSTIVQGDALRLPAGRGTFDLIFADPPYAPGSGSAAAAAVVAAGWSAPSALLAIESARGDLVTAQGLEIVSERDLGSARLTILQAASPSPLS